MNEEGKRGEAPGKNTDWNEQADFYNKFVFCELEDTKTYLDTVGILPDDTVLDVCCGPGRISVVAAQRARQVTAFDAAEKMLAAAQSHIKDRGLDNVELRLLDWNHVLPGQNVSKHDVVIASRNPAMFEVEKLSALANKKVVLQIFADAPSIPSLVDVLYAGCGEEPGRVRCPSGPGGSGGSGGKPGFMGLVNRAYDAGYLPNVRIMPERFRKTFATREEAVAWVCSIKPERAAGFEERVALNVEPFLSETAGGVEFCIATRAAIIWWEV